MEVAQIWAIYLSWLRNSALSRLLVVFIKLLDISYSLIVRAKVAMRLLGVAIGLIAIILILFGVLKLVSNKKDYYLPEGFTSDSIVAKETQSEPAVVKKLKKYPTNRYRNIKNPILNVIKRLKKLGSFFTDKDMWQDTMRLSSMSVSDLARENILKELALKSQ